MRYSEIDAPRELQPWVKCAWIFETGFEARAAERIVPDGRAELVVHAGAAYAEAHGAGDIRPQPRAIFAGQLTQPLLLHPTGTPLVAGVRFHPDGARAFFGRPMREANDRRIDIDDIFPGASGGLVRDVLGGPGDEGKAEALFRFVAARIDPGAAPDAVVRSCVEALEVDPVQPLEPLLARVQIGRRQLERRFADAVGVGPATLAAILRFRRAFDLLERDGTRPWTDAALDAGYYDQSHFIRDFRRFVGCTPSEFLAAPGPLGNALVS